MYIIFYLRLIMFSTTAVAAGQNILRFVPDLSYPYDFGYGVSSSQSAIPSLVHSCKKLCASGMWVMYTAANYGKGHESTTLVYPVEGSRPSDCTSSSAESVLKTIKSVRLLVDDETGFTVCKKKYFLSCIEDSKVDEPITEEIQSVAFSTAVNKGFYKYVLCPRRAQAECECYDDKKGTRFKAPDLTNFLQDKSNSLSCFKAMKGSCSSDDKKLENCQKTGQEEEDEDENPPELPACGA